MNITAIQQPAAHLTDAHSAAMEFQNMPNFSLRRRAAPPPPTYTKPEDFNNTQATSVTIAKKHMLGDMSSRELSSYTHSQGTPRFFYRDVRYNSEIEGKYQIVIQPDNTRMETHRAPPTHFTSPAKFSSMAIAAAQTPAVKHADVYFYQTDGAFTHPPLEQNPVRRPRLNNVKGLVEAGAQSLRRDEKKIQPLKFDRYVDQRLPDPMDGEPLPAYERNGPIFIDENHEIIPNPFPSFNQFGEGSS